jgi:hypothetical protein
MTSTLFAAVLASAVAAPAPDEAVKLPTGPAPATVLMSVTKDGEFEITQASQVPTLEERTRTVNLAGGGVATEKYVVTVLKTVQVTRRIKGEGVKVYTAAGKEVDAKDVPDKLKKPTVVLFAADGNKVDPFYLKVIKPDTLVVVAPAVGGEVPTVPRTGAKPVAPPDKPK